MPLTGLDWTRGLSWKQLLNNNPGIIHPLQHWRHHHRATTVAAGSSLQVMTLAHALINKNTLMIHAILAVIQRDKGYSCSRRRCFLCCFSTSVTAVEMSQ